VTTGSLIWNGLRAKAARGEWLDHGAGPREVTEVAAWFLEDELEPPLTPVAANAFPGSRRFSLLRVLATVAESLASAWRHFRPRSVS